MLSTAACIAIVTAPNASALSSSSPLTEALVAPETVQEFAKSEAVQAAEDADEGEGAVGFETLPHGELKIGLSGMTFEKDAEGAILILGNDGEVREALPTNSILESGQTLHMHYSLINEKELLVQFISDDPNLQGWQCWTDNIAMGFATGTIAGCIAGAQCAPGAIGGTIVGFGNAIVNC